LAANFPLAGVEKGNFVWQPRKTNRTFHELECQWGVNSVSNQGVKHESIILNTSRGERSDFREVAEL